LVLFIRINCFVSLDLNILITIFYIINRLLPSTDGLDNDHWEKFKLAMNGWGKLQWVISERSKKADFLDLTISLKHGKILTRTFQKSMNLYLYIPPISAHPTSCFKGLIVGNFLRFRKQNDDKNFCTLIRNFANHLLARGHHQSHQKLLPTRSSNNRQKSATKNSTTSNNTNRRRKLTSSSYHRHPLPIPTLEMPSRRHTARNAESNLQHHPQRL
jgi:hypothetical protein